jgi:hypothetical protein
MYTFLKWASWVLAAGSAYLIFMGFIAYMLGPIQILGVHYGTYLAFGGFLTSIAIMVILLKISCKKDI